MATAQETAPTQAATAAPHATQAPANDSSTNKVTPLAGATTVDKDYSFPTQVLAYSASEQLVSNIASKISGILQSRRTKLTTARVLIYQANNDLPAQRAAYKQVLDRVSSIAGKLKGYETNFEAARDANAHLPDPIQSASTYLAEARAALATPVPTVTSTPAQGRMALLPSLQDANQAITAVNSTLQSVIQLISLFRTDSTITTVPVSIDIDALAAQLGHCLQTSSPAPIIEYPSSLTAENSPVLQAFGEMGVQQNIVSPHLVDIDALVASLTTRQGEIEEQIKKQLPLGTPPSDELSKIATLATQKSKDDQQVRINRLTGLRQRIAALDPIATALDKSLQTIDDKTGVAPLSAIVKTEILIEELNNPSTYGVQLKIVAGGGATKIDKNLFTGSKLSQLGGAIFVTTLTNSDGRILFTNLSKGFLGYSRLKSTGGVVQQDLMPQQSQPSSPR
jgi:hypothetical protein